MKKGFFLFLVLSVMTVPLFAQKKTEVLLRFSKQEGLMRIVFESEESFINKTKAAASSSQIKIEFPEPFNLTAQKDLPFEVVPTNKLLVINLKEEGEIKLLRLSSPARLVFDIQKREKQLAAILSKVFVLDAGHGGYDFGITSGDIKEKDISLGLAKDLYAILLKKAKKVFLTRRVDQYMSLIERIKFVNQKSPDVFISLHSSMSENFVLYVAKFEDEGPDEIVDLYGLSSRQKKYIRKSRALSDSLGRAIKDEFKKNVIYREMPLPILNSTGAPSVVIEFPSPRFVIYDQSTKARLVNSIINGLTSYGQ
ncbi:MAG: N-acetylmuramoyl-L-alanine amidase [Nitrospirota bacterium]